MAALRERRLLSRTLACTVAGFLVVGCGSIPSSGYAASQGEAVPASAVSASGHCTGTAVPVRRMTDVSSCHARMIVGLGPAVAVVAAGVVIGRAELREPAVQALNALRTGSRRACASRVVPRAFPTRNLP